MEIAKEHASNFEGFHKRSMPGQLPSTLRGPSDYATLDQHDADLVHLRLAAAAAYSRSTGDTQELEGALLDALDAGQGQIHSQSQIRADDSSDGLPTLVEGLVQGHASAADAVAVAALQAATAERARVDEVMAGALELLLWDGGLGELLGLELDCLLYTSPSPRD